MFKQSLMSKVQVSRICRVVVGTVLCLTIVSPLVAAADNVVNSPEEKKLLSGITQLDAGDRSAYAVTADGTKPGRGVVGTALLVMGRPHQRILPSKCISIM